MCASVSLLSLKYYTADKFSRSVQRLPLRVAESIPAGRPLSSELGLSKIRLLYIGYLQRRRGVVPGLGQLANWKHVGLSKRQVPL